MHQAEADTMSKSSEPSATSELPQHRRPPVPHPDARNSEVREYLTGFFCDFHKESMESGLEYARRFNWDGRHLYRVSENRLREEFGEAGRVLFNEIQSSPSGQVRPSIVLS